MFDTVADHNCEWVVLSHIPGWKPMLIWRYIMCLFNYFLQWSTFQRNVDINSYYTLFIFLYLYFMCLFNCFLQWSKFQRNFDIIFYFFISWELDYSLFTTFSCFIDSRQRHGMAYHELYQTRCGVCLLSKSKHIVLCSRNTIL